MTMDDKKATAPAPGSAGSLSSRIWGVDWSKHFPLAVGPSGLAFVYASYDECADFIAAHFSEVYAGISNGRFHEQCDPQLKSRFYRLVADFFLLKDGDRNVGIAAGNPVDWSTYNLRNVSILGDYRGSGAYQAFFPYLCRVLGQNGVLRVDGDVAPTNLPHIHALNKMGVMVTGMNLSERWGAMLHFTAFLDQGVRADFSQHFCEVDAEMTAKIAKAS